MTSGIFRHFSSWDKFSFLVALRDKEFEILDVFNPDNYGTLENANKWHSLTDMRRFHCGVVLLQSSIEELNDELSFLSCIYLKKHYILLKS